MPNKNHRWVKMSESTGLEKVSVWRVFASVLLAGLAAIGAIISGGIGSGAVGLFAAGPLLFWLLRGVEALRIALFSAFVGLGLVALMQVFGQIPPPIPEVGIAAGWLSAATFIGCGVWLVLRIASLRRSAPVDPTADDRPETMSELPEDGPLLLVEVTPLGRIRRIAGARALMPDVRPGRAAERVLRAKDGSLLAPGRATLESGFDVVVWKDERDTGPIFMIMPVADEPKTHEPDLARQLRERTDFFAGLGHDLKSPLNAVIGFSEIMESELRGPLPDAYKSYPGLIRESGQTLLRLVEDMLGFARSESGTYEIDPSAMDITSSAEAVLRQSEADAKRAGVRLMLKAPGEVLAMADAGAVHRIWDNLVSNAIKYSNPDSEVVMAVQARGKQVILSVTDQGAGMDASDLQRIARPFEQGRNARGRAGTGLGLAMVKRLAEMHGGKMVIRTAPGAGTQVVVVLPAVMGRSSEAAE